MSIEVGNMIPDASISGTELIPVSDAGAPKSITPSGIKDFVISKMGTIPASTSVNSADGVYILHGDNMMYVDIGLVCQMVISRVWDKAEIVTPKASDVIPAKDGETEGTLTLASLVEFVRAALEESILDVSKLSALMTICGDDQFLVTRGSIAKKMAFSEIAAAVHSGFAAYLTGLTTTDSPLGDDVFYILRGGVEIQVSLSQIADFLGTGIGGYGSENCLALWSDANTLGVGPVIATDIGTGSDNALATTKAVRNCVSDMFGSAESLAADLESDDQLMFYDTSEASSKKGTLEVLVDYLKAITCNQSVKNTLVNADRFSIIDSEDDATSKGLTAGGLWSYIAAKFAAIIDVSSWGFVVDEDDMASNSSGKIPTQQSVKAYFDQLSGSVAMLDVDGATDATEDLTDSDLIIVKQAASETSGKSAISRIWTYIQSKLTGYKLDGFASPDDSTDLDATVDLHGLMSKSDKAKLDGMEDGAQANVQADWHAVDGDALILNKPTTITTAQSSAITLHGQIIAEFESAIAANTAKAGISPEQATGLAENSIKLDGIEEGAQVNVQPDWEATTGDAQILNKPSTITTAQADAIIANTAKRGITDTQSDTIMTNASKLADIEEGAQVNVQADWNATAGDALILNKPVTITPEQADAIAANTAKAGITTEQANAIITNTAKAGITPAQAEAITTSTTKLAGIEDGAQVNVQADWNATAGDAQILNKPSINTTTEVRGAANAVDTVIPTEKAVRAACDAISAAAGATVNGITTENNLAQWDTASGQLKDGPFVAVGIREIDTAIDAAVSSERAVRVLVNQVQNELQSSIDLLADKSTKLTESYIY